MKTNLIREMLLIEDPSVFKLYTELTTIAQYFVAPVFMIAIIFEFFGDMNFFAVLKKLVIIIVFMSAFYQFHTAAVDTALETASITLQKVSPNNFFMKKWYEPKVRTADNKSWGSLERLAIPNLNDFLATALFVISKAFIWLLKLIYSTVYHLTYVFSGITAVLYFLGWTQDGLKGTVQASLWCMILPFVVVAILALVGNSFQFQVVQGTLAVSSIDNLIWLFGVTLLLLITPAITLGMVKGDGPHSFAPKVTSLMKMGAGSAMVAPAVMKSFYNKAQSRYYRAKWLGKQAVGSVMSKLRPQKSGQQSSANTASPSTVTRNNVSASNTSQVNSSTSEKPFTMAHTSGANASSGSSSGKTSQASTQSRITGGQIPSKPTSAEKVHEQKSGQFAGIVKQSQATQSKMQTRDIKTTVPNNGRMQISKILGPSVSKTSPPGRDTFTRPSNRPQIQRPSLDRGRNELR